MHMLMVLAPQHRQARRVVIERAPEPGDLTDADSVRRHVPSPSSAPSAGTRPSDALQASGGAHARPGRRLRTCGA